MKMFHRSHIVAQIIRQSKQTHHDDDQTMENLHRSHNALKSHENTIRWKNDGNLPSFTHRA